jgi:hypothetical protein
MGIGNGLGNVGVPDVRLPSSGSTALYSLSCTSRLRLLFHRLVVMTDWLFILTWCHHVWSFISSCICLSFKSIGLDRPDVLTATPHTYIINCMLGPKTPSLEFFLPFSFSVIGR